MAPATCCVTLSAALVSSPTGRGLVVVMTNPLKMKGTAPTAQRAPAGVSPMQLSVAPPAPVKLAVPVGYFAMIPVIGLLALFWMSRTNEPEVVPVGTSRLPETVTRLEPPPVVSPSVVVMVLVMVFVIVLVMVFVTVWTTVVAVVRVLVRSEVVVLISSAVVVLVSTEVSVLVVVQETIWVDVSSIVLAVRPPEAYRDAKTIPAPITSPTARRAAPVTWLEARLCKMSQRFPLSRLDRNTFSKNLSGQ